LTQGAVDLVGGDMKETDRSFVENLPHRLEEDESPKDIGFHEGAGIFNGSVHMGFGSKVHDGLHPIADPLLYSRGIHNVPSGEMVTGRVGEIGEVFQISSISQLVDIDQRILWMGLQKIANKVASDEPATPCD
jgi:hypothetical protein